MMRFLSPRALLFIFVVLVFVFLLLSFTNVPSGPTKCSCSDAKKDVGATKKDSNHYLLVILVLSSLQGKGRRDAIRETWMKEHVIKDLPVLIKFALGTEGLDPASLAAIKSESEEHKDLLFLSNLVDSYENLTRKVLHSFIALDDQFSFSYLMKCDDDTFVLLGEVYEELYLRDSKKSFYWGFFDGRAHVKKQGKWEEKGWFLCDRYLPYALGGGYVLSHDLVHRITSTADGLQFYISEDVSVGVWLSPYEAERKHDVRFNTEFVSRGCRNSYIVSHKQSIEDMQNKYTQIKTSYRGAQCEKEFQTRMSYEYNWNVEPTKCCERRKDVP